MNNRQSKDRLPKLERLNIGQKADLSLSDLIQCERSPAINSERSLIGGLFIGNVVMSDVMDVIKPGDFTIPAHTDVYMSILRCHAKYHKIDVHFIVDDLRSKKQLDSICGEDSQGRLNRGVDYVIGCMDEVFEGENCMIYAEQIAEASRARKLMNLATRMIGTLAEGGDTQEVMAKMELEATQLMERADGVEHISLEDAWRREMDRIDREESTPMVTTGFNVLDRGISGYACGHMTAVAARPGLGKTEFMVTSIQKQIDAGERVAVFTLEEETSDLTMRFMRQSTMIPQWNLRDGKLKQDDREALEAEPVKNMRPNLQMIKAPGLQVSKFRAEVGRYAALGYRCFWIDYLQLMRCKGASTRYEIITEVSQAVRKVALEFSVAIVCLCQMNRDAEKRENKWPVMSDLRESGQIEQDASTILALHSEEYYQNRNSTSYDIDIAKLKVRYPGPAREQITMKYSGSRYMDDWENPNPYEYQSTLADQYDNDGNRIGGDV